MKETFKQLFRYGVVGLTSNAAGYLLYILITYWGAGHKLTMTFLYLLVTLQTFIFNKKWSFKHGGASSAAMIRYFVAYGLGYTLNLVALLIFVDSFGYPHQVVQGVLIVALAILLFLLQKFWVFRPVT